MIRNALKRLLTGEYKNKDVELTIVEASNGLECITALYLANINQITVNAIISDETMPYISGSHSSKIINEMISNGSIKDLPMFITTALAGSTIKGNYSSVVKKIYTKPIDKTMVKNLLDFIKY